MKLTSDQACSVEKWFRQKIEHHSCDLCQANAWRVGHYLVAPDATPDAPLDGAMVQFVCSNCGHVLLFDANLIEGLKVLGTSVEWM